MLAVGDRIRWMCPLDNDYTYGEILSIHRKIATVRGIGLYRHITGDIHFKYIEKIAGGRNCGGGKKSGKLYPTKGKL